VRWRLPFPFVMLADGPKEIQRDFWPFYGYRRVGGYVRHFALWPIVRLEDHDRGAVITTRRYFLPLVWLFEDHDKATDEAIYKQTKIWPLFRLDRSRDGSWGMQAPSPLWFNDAKEDMDGSFDQILPALWEVFRYRDDPKRAPSFASSSASSGALGRGRRDRRRVVLPRGPLSDTARRATATAACACCTHRILRGNRTT